MGKYTQDAQQLLRLIGGKENIAAVSHCVGGCGSNRSYEGGKGKLHTGGTVSGDHRKCSR